MQHAGSFFAYEELIKKGWFIDQFAELARDLEVLERYGHMEREQRRQLLDLAHEVQSSHPARPGGDAPFSSHSPALKPFF